MITISLFVPFLCKTRSLNTSTIGCLYAKFNLKENRHAQENPGHDKYSGRSSYTVGRSRSSGECMHNTVGKKASSALFIHELKHNRSG